MSVDHARINNTMGKFASILADHQSICVSVSGGSDSDIIVHIICTNFREYLPKIHFLFADTGIEYRATLQHLSDLEEKYNIKIEPVRGMPIPLAVRKYGVPFISKLFSDHFERLQKHNFQWEDGTMQELWSKYPRCKVGIRFWTNDWGEKSKFNINWVRLLKEFMIDRKPKTKFSSMCCYVSKKDPLVKRQKELKADLYITGERKAEGGARSGAHNSCFERSIKHEMDHYMPLWFWDDETKAYYKESQGIKYSDCYEVYGLRRTGCVGCPFAKTLWEELEIMKKYEPQCYKLCVNVFGDSYILRKEFELFRRPVN